MTALAAEDAAAESSTRPDVLVAGIGNIFLGDDGFGVEVANRLKARPSREGVRVVEYGIRGLHLAYELLDGYDTLVLIDAVSIGEPPGTVAVVEPDRSATAAPALDAHSMNPEAVLGMLDTLGGQVRRVLVVGCQPAVISETMGLSSPVANAVEEAVGVVEGLLEEFHATTRTQTSEETG
ncbi:MAG: hydrogenase maturation protease [Actinomycetota bacterium]|nr:hydrogenase maturation protease [Actinomycetota bacterium]